MYKLNTHLINIRHQFRSRINSLLLLSFSKLRHWSSLTNRLILHLVIQRSVKGVAIIHSKKTLSDDGSILIL